MNKEITTKGIQDNFKKISENFTTLISNYKNFTSDYTELSLLLNKANSNISAIIYLTSKAMFNEACIIFRSLFETVVLFIYLVEYPNKMEQYKLDDLIAEFHFLYLSYKRGYVPISYLIEPYNILIKDFKEVIPFEEISDAGIITYNMDKLDKYFKSRESKPLSQQTIKLINELLTSNNPHKDLLHKLQLEFYNVYAQISHNRLNSLLKPIKTDTDKEMLNQIQDMYKNCVVIYKIIFETLENEFQFPHPDNFYNDIKEMANYLDIKNNFY